MRNKLIILLVTTLLVSCDSILINKKEIELKIQESLEYAYFEGQKDCLEGDVRIKKISDSCYVWVKNPWNNDSLKPIYKPNTICKDTIN